MGDRESSCIEFERNYTMQNAKTSTTNYKITLFLLDVWVPEGEKISEFKKSRKKIG
jgi:response regulator of citrate/malate metabolism